MDYVYMRLVRRTPHHEPVKVFRTDLMFEATPEGQEALRDEGFCASSRTHQRPEVRPSLSDPPRTGYSAAPPYQPRTVRTHKNRAHHAATPAARNDPPRQPCTARPHTNRAPGIGKPTGHSALPAHGTALFPGPWPGLLDRKGCDGDCRTEDSCAVCEWDRGDLTIFFQGMVKGECNYIPMKQGVGDRLDKGYKHN